MKSRIADDIKMMPAAFFIGYLILYIRNYFLILQVDVLPDLVDKAMLVIGLLFCFIYILSNINFYKKRLALLLLIVGLVGFSYIKNGETSPLVSLVVIIAAATAADNQTLAKMWLVITSFIVAFTVTVYFTTLVISPSSIHFVTRLQGADSTIRHGFFLCHPNMVAALLAMIFCCSIYLMKKKRLASVIFALMMFGVYKFTDSRTPFILFILVAALYFVLPSMSLKLKKMLAIVVEFLPVILLLAVFLLSGPLFSDGLRDMFSARIGLWHACFNNQGISLFGDRFIATSSVEADGSIRFYTTLDSFYASCLFVYGIPFTFAFILINYLTIHDCDDVGLVVIFLFFWLEGFTEGHLTNLIFGLPLLLMGSGVFRMCKSRSAERSQISQPSAV